MTTATPEIPAGKRACPAFIDAARVEWKLGSYGITVGSALRDVDPWLRTQDYRRMVAARMQPWIRRRCAAICRRVSTSCRAKYDGEFTVLLFREGEACCVNPGGTVRIGPLPWLVEAAQRLRAPESERARRR